MCGQADNGIFITWVTADRMPCRSVCIRFPRALFTGLGIYANWAKRLVPVRDAITGFIIPSYLAMEFKREGYIFGVGAKIFSIAGPTLLFGFTASVLIGLAKLVIMSM